jgi:hypothetical protein
MRTRTVRGGAALGAAALVLAAAAGCGSDGNDKSAPRDSLRGQSGHTPVHAIQAVAKKTSEAKSARYDATVTAPGGMGSIQMSGTIGWDPVAMDATMTGKMLEKGPGAPGKIRMRMSGNVMYMYAGGAAVKEFGGKHWLKMDLTKMAKVAGGESAADQMLGGLNGQSQNADPAKQTAMMLDSKKIKKVGQEKIGGVDTTHYAGTVSLKEAMNSDKSLDHMSKAERDKLFSGMEKQGIDSVAIDVWVDGKDYPVQIKESFDSKMGPMKMQMRFSDWGAKVNTQAPPAGDTFDLSSMLDKQKAQS